MEVKTGDLFFTRNDSLFSKATRLVSTGRSGMDVPSHGGVVTCVYTLNGRTEVGIIEACFFGGVKYTKIDKYRKDKLWFARMKGQRAINFGIDWLETQLGKSYDHGALVGILIKAALRWSQFNRLQNFLESRSRFFCSELVSVYGEKTGEKLWHHPASSTTPYDLFRSEQLKFYEPANFSATTK